jgi:enoyl-CoA hydratase
VSGRASLVAARSVVEFELPPEETVQGALVQSEDRDRVRVLRLCRPPVNALDLELARAAHGALAEAGADDRCTGVVLTGAPGVFSAGIDTRAVPAYDAEMRAEMLRAVNRTVLALYALAKPAAAAVSGHALGGAFVLMLACDVRLVARGPFKLGLTEAGAGIPFPAGPLAVVRAELSPDQVRTLAIGSLAAGPESEAFAGVIDRVVEAPDLLDSAIEEVRRLAALPAFGRVKRQLRAHTIERLERIVERDEEPLLAGWT